VRYARGGEPAVAEVDLDLAPGEVLLVTGGAGSGKSSVLHAIVGLAPVTGELTVLGAPPGDPSALRRVGFAPQGRPVEPRLTVRETAELVARIKGASPEEAVEALAALALPDARTPAGRLDPEAMRRLTLALARIGDPDLVVLDDPWEMPETLGEIARATARGAAVVVASAEPGSLGRLASRTLRLGDGRPA
jgi:ABC-type multidrug transport system ATPase subunit